MKADINYPEIMSLEIYYQLRLVKIQKVVCRRQTPRMNLKSLEKRRKM